MTEKLTEFAEFVLRDLKGEGGDAGERLSLYVNKAIGLKLAQACLESTEAEEPWLEDIPTKKSNFVTVPAGTYKCRVAEVRPGVTRAGDERWSLCLVVAEGQHVGKQAAWDSLVFSARARARARTVLQALGAPARPEPSDLEGKTAWVEIRPATYQGADGFMVTRNEVPYDGYKPCE